MNMFLTPDEVSQLTGREQKSLQIEALMDMGIPFYVNASGRPVVPSAAISGNETVPKKKQVLGWQSDRVK